MAYPGKATLLTHIYNEEYLLPFWLEHHKKLFDYLVVVDYNSTDSSLEICKRIWPECIIFSSRNKEFDAEFVDYEMMDIENHIQGIKVVLNTTEFLFCKRPLKEIFGDSPSPLSYEIRCVSPYSKNTYDIHSLNELLTNVLNKDVVCHNDRGVRQIFTYPNGAYKPAGRHDSWNPRSLHNDMIILWFGFYPMNEHQLKRKLQINARISARDKRMGRGFQHFFTQEQMLNINTKKAETGVPLQEFDTDLHKLILFNLVA
jgi:hypothetical protein